MKGTVKPIALTVVLFVAAALVDACTARKESRPVVAAVEQLVDGLEAEVAHRERIAVRIGEADAQRRVLCFLAKRKRSAARRARNRAS